MRRRIVWVLIVIALFIFGFMIYEYWFGKQIIILPPQVPPEQVQPPVAEKIIPLTSPVDFIVVKKHQRKMTVFYKGVELKSYPIALGFSPLGHKEQVKDGKTPEGTYTITHKNPNSRFYKSIGISYPSKEDRKNASRKGVSPGGDIMIHGLAKPFAKLGKLHLKRDWTLGCIAVTNEEMDELFTHVKVGAKITIEP